MTEETLEEKATLLDRFAEVSAKVGNQVHLRSLRDAFATMTPIYILAGIAVLINNVFFPLFLKDAALKSVQYWGTSIALGTLNFSAVILAGLIGYCLARNKRFENAIACVIIGISSLVVMMPQVVTVTLDVEAKTTASVGNAFVTNNTGTNGLFAAIIIGLLATTLFIRLSSVERLKVRLGEGVPPAVAESFNVMIPMMLTLSIFALVSALLFGLFATDLLAIIAAGVAAPLKGIMNAGPWAVIVIYTFANLLFCLGIHQSTISGVLAEPILTVLIVDNMATFASGGPIPADHYMNMQIVNSFALIGGSGCTLALLLDTFIFSKNRVSKDVAKLSILPGIFNINEPVIYGYPIVFNLSLMVPFVLVPDILIAATYGLTCAGIISPCVVQVPWTTPAVLSALFATAGDWRAAVWQVIEIALAMAVYLPFMRVSEKAQAKQAEAYAVEDGSEG
jgi:PTS system, lactose/cellobiose family IIC component